MQALFTREELYELVWTYPLASLCARYGISGPAVIDACRQSGIAFPAQNYWANRDSEQKMARRALRERGPGMPRRLSFEISEPESATLMAKFEEPTLTPPPPFDESLNALRSKIRLGKVKVARDFTRVHPLIRRLLDADQRRAVRYASSGHRISRDTPYFNSPFEQRRLKALNALFLALEKIGVRVSCSGRNPKDFQIRIGMSDVTISIDDPAAERTDWDRSDGSKSANTTMVATIGSGMAIDGIDMTWSDTAERRVETVLTDVAINVVVAGESMCRERELAHYHWLVQGNSLRSERARSELEENQRLDREHTLREEKARLERLVGDASAHHQAQQIRAYVHAVKISGKNVTDPTFQLGLSEWSAWALEQADDIDPVKIGVLPTGRRM